MTTNGLVENRANNIVGYLGLVPSFLGGDDSLPPTQFIETVEEVSAIAGWGDLEKLLVVKTRIKGSAMEFLNHHPDIRKTKCFETFKKEFLRFFHKDMPLVVRLKQLTGCKQKPGESVKQFAGRVKSFAHDYLQGANYSIPEVQTLADRTRLSQFLSGLNPKIQRAVLSRTPETLEDAINAAVLEETNDQICGGGSVNSTQADTDAASVIQLLLERDRERESILNNIQRELSDLKLRVSPAFEETGQRMEGGGPRDSRRCFICSRVGHLMRDCPQRDFSGSREQEPTDNFIRDSRVERAHGGNNGSAERNYRRQGLNFRGRPSGGATRGAPAFRN